MDWCVFSNCELVDKLETVNGVWVKHYHGTTLWQAQCILKQGFITGLYHGGTRSSPCGIWGCTRRGDALDRVHLVRGWSRQAGEEPMSAWDCPVVLCIFVLSDKLRHHRTLWNGTGIYCLPFQPGTLVDFARQYCEIHIHAHQYRRFKQLNATWDGIKNGSIVMCRCVRADPSSLFNDNPGPMTCGRILPTNSDEFLSWRRANQSKQYRCPTCDFMYSCQLPFAGHG